jgi:phosphatidylserine decarboxylase
MTYLQSSESRTSLIPDGGWLSTIALQDLSIKAADGGTPLPFDQIYNCDPSKPHYGFGSWDQFFTRTFRAGIREVASPGDDSVIVNACEAAPYRLAQNVSDKAQFWTKGQPYSLKDILDNDPLASYFAGGTVYQAFLSALSYHRWHSPVKGTIRGTPRVVQGTYYAETWTQGDGDPLGPDPAAPNNSQAFISAVATRAIIFIEADNSDIGLVCVVLIGMAEVSSCDIRKTLVDKTPVEKGEELGMFHFGGSSHCLIFGPHVNLTWVDAATPPYLLEDEYNLPVCSKLATANKSLGNDGC